MSKVPFKQVDVFSNQRFKGNPVCVVLGAVGLTTAQMRGISTRSKLPETTFVVPKKAADADYRVRTFIRGREMHFPGHTTIGTAYALLEAGLVKLRDGSLIQESASGLLRLEISGKPGRIKSISFDIPEPAFTPLDQRQVDELECALGAKTCQKHSPAIVNVGAQWIIAQVDDAEAVLAARPDFQMMREQNLKAGATGVVIFGERGNNGRNRFEVRAFAPSCLVDEDPVCGNGNGAVAAFLQHTDQIGRFGSSYIASQGSNMGRAGSIHLAVRGDRIQVTGAAITCIDGEITV